MNRRSVSSSGVCGHAARLRSACVRAHPYAYRWAYQIVVALARYQRHANVGPLRLPTERVMGVGTVLRDRRLAVLLVCCVYCQRWEYQNQ